MTIEIAVVEIPQRKDTRGAPYAHIFAALAAHPDKAIAVAVNGRHVLGLRATLTNQARMRGLRVSTSTSADKQTVMVWLREATT
jgi:hypothetical protein